MRCVQYGFSILQCTVGIHKVLIIRILRANRMMRSFLFCVVLAACAGKPSPENENREAIEVDSATEFYEQADDKTVYDYNSFRGIYDHESTTAGFAAVLAITESGNDLSFTLSVSQGTCKGEAEGKILMVSHEENYHVGFFELDQCPLQFSLMLHEDKIDVKEVNLCRLHDSSCAFEGTYVKRKN